MKKKNLISVAHSYCVGLNRRLVDEIDKLPSCDWKPVAVAPLSYPGDFGLIQLQTSDSDTCTVKGIPVRFSKRIHVMLYGRELSEILQCGDLIHCSEEPYVFCGGQVAWLTDRRKLFVFHTAQNIRKSYPPPFGWIEKFCLDRCAGWTACGKSIIETRPRYYLNKPHRVMPLGVDVSLFRPDSAMRAETLRKLGWQDNQTTFGFIGRFVEEKGVRLIVDSLDRLKSSWRILFVGGGPLQAELNHFSSRYADRVRIVTGVSHLEMPAYINAMDALVAPSQTRANWREQFGRMIIEAFACGVPVVASDSGEIPNVVGDAGLVIPENSLQDWVNALESLLSDTPLRLRLSNAGLERVHQKYAWPVIARQHCDFFDELDSTRN